jgi:hypothetical protein
MILSPIFIVGVVLLLGADAKKASEEMKMEESHSKNFKKVILLITNQLKLID